MGARSAPVTDPALPPTFRFEFGRNGGKETTFERISVRGVDIGFDVGAPLSPDLVASHYNWTATDSS